MAGEATIILGGQLDGQAPYCSPDPANDLGSAAIGPLTNTTATQALAAPGSGKHWYIYGLLITNEHASVDTVVQILSASTVKWHGLAKANGGGFSETFPFNCPIRCGDNEAVMIACLTTGSAIRASVAAVKSGF